MDVILKHPPPPVWAPPSRSQVWRTPCQGGTCTPLQLPALRLAHGDVLTPPQPGPRLGPRPQSSRGMPWHVEKRELDGELLTLIPNFYSIDPCHRKYEHYKYSAHELARFDPSSASAANATLPLAP